MNAFQNRVTITTSTAETSVSSVLIVDDRRENLLAMEAVLDDMGFNLVCVGSGAEALRTVLNQDFAVILMDVDMPLMDGFETARMIRSREKSKHIPIIFFSAVDTTDTHVMTGYSTGAVDYLVKPINAEILRSKIAVFTELQQKNEQVKKQAYELALANRELRETMAELRKAQEKLKILNAELETRVADRTKELARSNAELRQFAYIASHDLQEPLRMIQGYAGLLSRRYTGKLDKSGDEFIQFMLEGTKRMQKLVHSILEHSNVGDKGQLFKPVDCMETLKDVLVNLRSALQKCGASINYDLLPTVMADSLQLQQLFQNLIANAIKFQKPGEKPRVEITAQQHGDFWRFAVSDNGIGIEEQYQEQIFQMFKRLHGRNNYPGSGMGLAICKKIVEGHGGTIWLESKPGTGSTFYFSLPAAADSAPEQPDDKPGEAPGKKPGKVPEESS